MASDVTVPLTAKQARALLPKGKTVHVIIDAMPALLGVDWNRAQVLELIARGARCEMGGERCRRGGHGLVIWRKQTPLFVATSDDVDWDALEAKILGDVG